MTANHLVNVTHSVRVGVLKTGRIARVKAYIVIALGHVRAIVLIIAQAIIIRIVIIAIDVTVIVRIRTIGTNTTFCQVFTCDVPSI